VILKRVLIISPNFPPVNSADMHRVRQSVGYFQEMGWVPTVVMVDPAFSEYKQDPLLMHTLPEDLEIIQVKAFSTRWTRKFGLGSLGFRSLWFYYHTVNHLLRRQKYDLIYFSTTMFPVLILGAHWKRQFQIPYVIDMQDPWHSEYYQNKPKHEQPPKYWFSYRLNKYLEPVAMHSVDGIISVSPAYNPMLQERYPNIRPEDCTVIPFGAFEKDREVLERALILNPLFESGSSAFIRVAYVGRAGHDMRASLTQLFRAFRLGLHQKPELFTKVRMYFVGTDYAPDHLSKKTVLPVAQQEGVQEYVVEHSPRVPYFTGLKILADADMLVMPGSDDPKYTASKLYPYIMARKPLLAIFRHTSSVIQVLNDTQAGRTVAFDDGQDVTEDLYQVWIELLQRLPFTPSTRWEAFEPYTAREMTRKQVRFFNQIVAKTTHS